MNNGQGYWQHLTIFPEGSTPAYYPVESLTFMKGMLFEVIRDCCDRGVPVVVILSKNYGSPLRAGDLMDYETSILNQ